ncbi:MAG: hypothetical protein Ct9H90mP16_17490 [Candidatus Poseidoniales archaeon]|nr:MAG: hypothetical protein Ct9H90mP16_17490 [Candidatus Poseidoniales archaeon]
MERRLGGLGLSAKKLQKIPHVRLLGCGTALMLLRWALAEQLARVPTGSRSSEFRHKIPLLKPMRFILQSAQTGETQIHLRGQGDSTQRR